MRVVLIIITAIVLMIAGGFFWIDFWPSETHEVHSEDASYRTEKEMKNHVAIKPDGTSFDASGEIERSASYPFAIEAAMRSIKPGIVYLPLMQMNLPLELQEKMRQELNNLRKTGSMSGGVVTSEFGRADEFNATLQSKGKEKIQKELAIIPTDLSSILGG